MGDDRRGFSKLNEENSIHGSVFQNTATIESCGLHNGTRINLGFGRCLKLRVKAERDEGSLRIGGLALAANCHHIVLIFGFFFLLAGAVLTTLAYKSKSDVPSPDPTPRGEGKVAGPLFVVIGSTLILVGVGLTIVGWKVNQEAKRQMNHFSLQTPPPLTPETQDYFSAFANIQDSNFYNRGGTPSSQSSRRESFFNPNFFSDRRKTLPTIAQAVPVGFFMDGKLSGVPDSGSMSSRLHPCSPESCQVDKLNGISKELETEGSTDFNESAPYRKASLSLRPSLPIPIIASPSFIRSRVIAPLDPNCLIRTRSDEPFGSIVSLSGTGDIACFPAPPTPFAPCLEEDLPSCENVSETHVVTALPVSCRQLPTIQVNECTNSVANDTPRFVTRKGSDSSQIFQRYYGDYFPNQRFRPDTNSPPPPERQD
ncbi:unnamed protein product [Allacma fusca]|uniref:Uncharacterized protein n=1 Tax=Allacma fusca TaxID=39272 RepID=A0A8J2IXW3_9HEXA|nr:unnamed protein product [Allacma fusca]